mmetsp:Transcript_118247/g.329789  ORF Transcript_118247/g.329789 Transcript_118247/m.329789 type:complete len:267 (-) Transcript_118247:1750-2550(-)
MLRPTPSTLYKKHCETSWHYLYGVPGVSFSVLAPPAPSVADTLPATDGPADPASGEGRHLTSAASARTAPELLGRLLGMPGLRAGDAPAAALPPAPAAPGTRPPWPSSPPRPSKVNSILRTLLECPSPRCCERCCSWAGPPGLSSNIRWSLCFPPLWSVSALPRSLRPPQPKPGERPSAVVLPNRSGLKLAAESRGRASTSLAERGICGATWPPVAPFPQGVTGSGVAAAPPPVPPLASSEAARRRLEPGLQTLTSGRQARGRTSL